MVMKKIWKQKIKFLNFFLKLLSNKMATRKKLVYNGKMKSMFLKLRKKLNLILETRLFLLGVSFSLSGTELVKRVGVKVLQASPRLGSLHITKRKMRNELFTSLRDFGLFC